MNWWYLIALKVLMWCYEDFQHLNFPDSVKATGIRISCKQWRAGRAKQNSSLISLMTFFIPMHFCWPLLPISTYIGIHIYKRKYSMYIAISKSTIEVHAAKTPNASACLVDKNSFVSALSWLKTNSDTQSRRPFFRLSLKNCDPQWKNKTVERGNKWA